MGGGLDNSFLWWNIDNRMWILRFIGLYYIVECGFNIRFDFVFPDFHAVILMASSSSKELLSGKQLNYVSVVVCN